MIGLNVLSYDSPALLPGALNVWPHQAVKQELIEAMLAYRAGVARRIFARKTELLMLEPDVGRAFLRSTHLNGAAQASLYIGLVHDDELVQVAAFSTPRFTSSYELELVRLASALGTVEAYHFMPSRAGFCLLKPRSMV